MEGRGQDCLVETRVIYCFFNTKLNRLRTLRLVCSSTLTVVSDFTLCVRSGYPLSPVPSAQSPQPSPLSPVPSAQSPQPSPLSPVPSAQSTRPSLHSISLCLLLVLRWFLSGLSMPITAIKHRCSSFYTWPTYSPLSAEPLSRCRLRWTTPPSPQCPSVFIIYFGSIYFFKSLNSHLCIQKYMKNYVLLKNY